MTFPRIVSTIVWIPAALASCWLYAEASSSQSSNRAATAAGWTDLIASITHLAEPDAMLTSSSAPDAGIRSTIACRRSSVVADARSRAARALEQHSNHFRASL
jgi:hypothetical protein